MCAYTSPPLNSGECEFFEIFGRRRRDVAVYEEKVKKLNDKQGFIDLFWPGYLLVEQKSAGHSLTNARIQATDYFLSLKEREKPRYILLSDFQTFEMLDLEGQEEYRFALAELPEKVYLFDFVAGYQHQKYRDQDPVNIEASELMSNLHWRLEKSGYTGTHLERLLVRLMFCLFADDTGIFEPDSFLRFISKIERTKMAAISALASCTYLMCWIHQRTSVRKHWMNISPASLTSTAYFLPTPFAPRLLTVLCAKHYCSAAISTGARYWLFRYWITASIHVHFRPMPRESSSYSRGYGHTHPAL